MKNCFIKWNTVENGKFYVHIQKYKYIECEENDRQYWKTL